jgi:hypothetical protein
MSDVRLSVIERRNTLADLPAEIQVERVITSREAAAMRGVSDAVWKRMRKRGETPPAIKRGVRALGYKLRDVLAM